jgi:hypothetical protein
MLAMASGDIFLPSFNSLILLSHSPHISGVFFRPRFDAAVFAIASGGCFLPSNAALIFAMVSGDGLSP